MNASWICSWRSDGSQVGRGAAMSQAQVLGAPDVGSTEPERVGGTRTRRRRTRDISSPVTDGFVSSTKYAQVLGSPVAIFGDGSAGRLCRTAATRKMHR